MTLALNELTGITPALEAKFRALGITDSDQLLEAAKTPKQRQELAKKLGVPTRELLELANRADLARIKGIGSAYANLLEEAGVDTVKELATRRPDNLHAKLREVNDDGRWVKQLPTLSQVENWIRQAKQLPKLLEY